MSAPNKSYDPVEVSALSEEAVTTARDAALAAGVAAELLPFIDDMAVCISSLMGCSMRMPP